MYNVLNRRALLAMTQACLLAGCFGNTGMSPPAQDARLIVSAITPVAESAGGLGATPATVARINQNLATMRGEAATMATEYSPGQLDVQEFFDATQTLLQLLGGLNGLPPASVGVVDAATALLPGFAGIAERQPSLTARMTPEQARLLLQNARTKTTTAPALAPPPVPLPAAAPVSVPRGGRFHLSANDFDGMVHYEFWDSGQVIEIGTVASLAALETRFAAFKRQRLQQAPGPSP
jgi:hypothetical protein